MEALNRNGTWIITDLRIGRKPIGSKWVFKVKYQSSGEVERFKVRLAAKGFNQKDEIDYEETFSPMVKIVTVRCLLTIVVHNSWSIYQLDINNAFLYRELVEDVYTKLPKRYFDKNDNKVYNIIITGNNLDEIKKFMHVPLQSHLKLAFRVLRYLKSAPGNGISFVKDKELN
ncbi:ribonuclease H-like domain-containing protein [Tanacetum coccineum]